MTTETKCDASDKNTDV